MSRLVDKVLQMWAGPHTAVSAEELEWDETWVLDEDSTDMWLTIKAVEDVAEKMVAIVTQMRKAVPKAETAETTSQKTKSRQARK